MDELTAWQNGPLPEKLMVLLIRQVRLSTGGESSSIPWETAQSLLASLLYTLRLKETDSARACQLAGGDLEVELIQGRQRIRQKMVFSRRLWRHAAESGAAGDSQVLGETLLGIGEFWRHYDWRFAAHEIPCDIDYPLALPVPETQQGVDYLCDWLSRLETELRFQRCFPAAVRAAVWERFHPDYDDLPLNLYEPLAADALCCFALGREVRSLAVGPEERWEFAQRMMPLTGAEREALLLRWAEGLSETLDLPQGRDRRYLADYARTLLPRIQTAGEEGGWQGIFP